ncbi:hypothetical protein F5X98DRAFT_367818 [Xylaria grammica]|nr:hypothetical protein F5X98DRAFT_367818 [Xylaria grammica]
MGPTAKRPPSPPPLPPALTSHGAKRERPSVYLASLEAARPDFMDTPVYVLMQDKPLKPMRYFFYGTLTKPEILKHILDLREEPLLRPAKITGYELSSWGQYRALINGKPGAEVSGFAYEVQTIEHEFKLARYETNAYKLHPCQIIFTDGREPREISGNTFHVRGGRGGAAGWELQMGTRLPAKWKTPPEEILRRMGVNLGGRE